MPCGGQMSQQVYLPSYSIGEDVYKRVPQICSNYGKTAIVIGGEISLSKVKDKLLIAMKGTDIKIIFSHNLQFVIGVQIYSF